MKLPKMSGKLRKIRVILMENWGKWWKILVNFGVGKFWKNGGNRFGFKGKWWKVNIFSKYFFCHVSLIQINYILDIYCFGVCVCLHDLRYCICLQKLYLLGKSRPSFLTRKSLSNKYFVTVMKSFED